MNILFLFVSVPHLSSDQSIFSSLIHQFALNGHQVFVSSRVLERSNTHLDIEGGIPTLRIDCPAFTGVKSTIKKAIAYQEYTIKQLYYIKKHWGTKKIDLIISHSLPPEIGFVVGGLKRHFKCPFYLIQTDFIWQDAVAYGYFAKSGPICSYYRLWEKKMFMLANYIGYPTKGNARFIKDLYPSIDDSKFHYLPFWKKSIQVQPDFRLKEEMGLADKFIVVYGGSVGAAQRVEIMVDLAELCKDITDIVFLIIGKGSYLEYIRQQVADRGIGNFVFMDYLPKEKYLAFLSTCDVGLVILNEKMATPNFPSKSLSYLNMRIPILAALDYVTDFGDYLIENKAGLWAHSDRILDLKEKLLMYYQSKVLRQVTAENGYRLFINNLTPEHAYNRIMTSLE